MINSSRFGLVKARDLMVYEIDVQKGYTFPERYLKLSGIIQKRYNVSTRPIDMHNLEADVMTITRLANESISDNWGFYPVTEDEAKAMARDMKQIVNPAACLIAETGDGKACRVRHVAAGCQPGSQGTQWQIAAFWTVQNALSAPALEDLPHVGIGGYS